MRTPHLNLIKHDYTCSDADFERFLAKVQPDLNSGCWLWSAAMSGPYGKFYVSQPDRWLLAHRVSYTRLKGLVSDQMVLDHKCRVGLCVNPEHLEPVTFRENLARAPDFNGARTHCPAGHEFTKENTYLRKDVKQRGCKVCRKEQLAAFWLKKGGQAAYNRARRQTQ